MKCFISKFQMVFSGSLIIYGDKVNFNGHREHLYVYMSAIPIGARLLRHWGNILQEIDKKRPGLYNSVSKD